MSRGYVTAALRRQIIARARSRCEYCLVPADIGFLPHEIDHIIAEKHGGTTHLENLSYCCAVCNKRKGSDLGSLDPETGELVALFNPRKSDWHTHFILLGDGTIAGKTATGRTTSRFLLLNKRQRIVERRALIEGGLLVSE